MTNVTLPNSIKSIGECVFRGCSSLTSMVIPNRVTEIGSYTFSGCTGFTNITIPEVAGRCEDMAAAREDYDEIDECL